MRLQRRHLTGPILILTPLISLGCSEEAPKKPTTSATAAPIPSYTLAETRKSSIQAADLGKKWTEGELPEAFEEKKLRGCSNSDIPLLDSPEIAAGKFGEPEFRTTGANYARIIAIYPDEPSANRAMLAVQEQLDKCPENKHFPSKKLPDEKIEISHDDEWSKSSVPTSGWQHIRGIESVTYPRYVSIVNVRHLVFDYAQRGNLVFGSIYVQRLGPKDSSKPLQEKASEIFDEQLERFGDGV
ncbi:hypothetical protein EDD29_0365 [Actinocorallia herbida]|uniref:PknH-like protein n=1 Tax=Actinocorallia herbida TaxID=58109 RepID=A0A3N1CNI8_9ACTN|nr:hypothetical protein [Actinocorallia herbida]ROO82880.1 hypothetical protein EDD29_0365 [Actinocorallia herbida]